MVSFRLEANEILSHIGCWGCDRVIPDGFFSTCLELLWQKEKGEWITGLHGYKSSCKQAGGSATGPPGSRGARGSSRPAWVASHRGLLEQGPAGGKVPGGHLPSHKANPGHHQLPPCLLRSKASVCLYVSWKSGPASLLRKENLPHTCRIQAALPGWRASCRKQHRPHAGDASGWWWVFVCFLSFGPLFAFVRRLMAGCLSKIQISLPRERASHSAAQHSAGCTALSVFLVHWAGIFSFHASSITCRSDSKNLYHAHMNTNNLNSHFCFWKFIIIEVGLIKQLYFWNFSQNNQAMALPNGTA